MEPPPPPAPTPCECDDSDLSVWLSSAADRRRSSQLRVTQRRSRYRPPLSLHSHLFEEDKASLLLVQKRSSKEPQPPPPHYHHQEEEEEEEEEEDGDCVDHTAEAAVQADAAGEVFVDGPCDDDCISDEKKLPSAAVLVAGSIAATTIDITSSSSMHSDESDEDDEDEVR